MSLSVIAPFEDDLTNDPTTAFENDPAQAWEAITNNPSLLSNSDVLDVEPTYESGRFNMCSWCSNFSMSSDIFFNIYIYIFFIF